MSSPSTDAYRYYRAYRLIKKNGGDDQKAFYTCQRLQRMGGQVASFLVAMACGLLCLTILGAPVLLAVIIGLATFFIGWMMGRRGLQEQQQQQQQQEEHPATPAPTATNRPNPST